MLNFIIIRYSPRDSRVILLSARTLLMDRLLLLGVVVFGELSVKMSKLVACIKVVCLIKCRPPTYRSTGAVRGNSEANVLQKDLLGTVHLSFYIRRVVL